MLTTSTPAELQRFIIDAVTAHYERSSEPLLLAQLGVKLKDNGLAMPNGYSLKGYIQQRLSEDLRIVQHPQIPASVAVACPANIDDVKVRLIGESYSLLDLPRAMIIAFCHDVPEGQKIFLRSAPPIRYSLGIEKPDDSYVEIAPHYRLPPMRIQNANELPQDLQDKLRSSISSWLADHNFDYSDFTIAKTAGRDNAGKATATPANALQRLLDAQPAHVLRHMLIPGDVAALLMNRK